MILFFSGPFCYYYKINPPLHPFHLDLVQQFKPCHNFPAYSHFTSCMLSSLSSLWLSHCTCVLDIFSSIQVTSKSTQILYCNCSHSSLIFVIDQVESNYALTCLLTNLCVIRIDATTTCVAFLVCFSSHSFCLSFMILSIVAFLNVFCYKLAQY